MILKGLPAYIHIAMVRSKARYDPYPLWRDLLDDRRRRRQLVLALLLAPIIDKTEEAEVLSEYNSSVILRNTLASDGTPNAAKCLFGGDAEVAIWECMWPSNAAEDLEYHVLVAPHHCFKHSLPWDKWSEKGEKAVVSADARKALSHALPSATIFASRLRDSRRQERSAVALLSVAGHA